MYPKRRDRDRKFDKGKLGIFGGNLRKIEIIK